MSIEKCEGGYRIRFRPYDKLVNVVVNTKDKWEAKRVEKDIMLACRTSDFGELRGITKEAVLRMYRHQQWELPDELQDKPVKPTGEITLWAGAEIFLNRPEIKSSRECDRYVLCLIHLVKYFGKARPLKEIWIAEIRAYVAHRQAQGASPSTINREKGTLSKIFQVLEEARILEANPVRLVKNLSQKLEQRQAYISFPDVQKIIERCPAWYQPVVWTGYLSGMRKGEILGLQWKHIDLKKRMIYLRPVDTKEGKFKRVPIHRELEPVLEELKNAKVKPINCDDVFLVNGKPLGKDSHKRPWDRAFKTLDLDPAPRFNDLRHTWRSNARRSKMDPTVAEAIMGHAMKGRSVNDRYGYVSDQEYVDAIDQFRYDFNDETRIWLAR